MKNLCLVVSLTFAVLITLSVSVLVYNTLWLLKLVGGL